MEISKICGYNCPPGRRRKWKPRNSWMQEVGNENKRVGNEHWMNRQGRMEKKGKLKL